MLDKMKDYQAEYYERVKSELVPILKAAIDNYLPKQVLDFKASQDKYGVYSLGLAEHLLTERRRCNSSGGGSRKAGGQGANQACTYPFMALGATDKICRVSNSRFSEYDGVTT